MAFQVSSMSPQQMLQFQQGRSNARQNLLRNRASTQYQRGLAKQDYTDQLADFGIQQNRTREALPTNFVQRGIFNSGIYRQALRDYAVDRLRGQRNIQRGYQNQMGQLALQERGYEDEYSQTLANLYLSQQAAQAQIASALRGIQ